MLETWINELLHFSIFAGSLYEQVVYNDTGYIIIWERLYITTKPSFPDAFLLINHEVITEIAALKTSNLIYGEQNDS